MRDDNDERIEAIFQKAKSLNDQLSSNDNKVRVRMTYDPLTGNPTIDLAKADPCCQRCKGSGISRIHSVTTMAGIEHVPLVCICVKENGGVAPDSLDKAFARAALPRKA